MLIGIAITVYMGIGTVVIVAVQAAGNPMTQMENVGSILLCALWPMVLLGVGMEALAGRIRKAKSRKAS